MTPDGPHQNDAWAILGVLLRKKNRHTLARPTMNARDIFEQYRSEKRGAFYPGVEVERLPHLLRHVARPPSTEGMVIFAELIFEHAGKQIEEQVAFFQQQGQAFEWKVYDFDAPPELKQLLEHRGFMQREAEAFLVIDVGDWKVPSRELSGIRIEKVTELPQLQDFVAAETAIWSEDVSWHVQKYASDLAANPEALSIYCAYDGDTPVGTGRVSFPPGSFADLNGGGVVSTMRGRGIFTALLTHRIEEAKARGFRWVAVDAGPMSLPILLKKGFQHVCWTYPMVREK
jgi:GNAT superfamily N-acetyltransferase